jgi:hypothetical protein
MQEGFAGHPSAFFRGEARFCTRSAKAFYEPMRAIA